MNKQSFTYNLTKDKTSLQSVVINEPTVILSNEFGDKYLNYRQTWMDAARKNLKLSFPIHLDIEICDACNLDCKFCLEKQRGWSKERFSSHLLKKILHEANNFDHFSSINLSYNAEALYDKNHFVEIIKLFDFFERPFDIFVHTNGVNLDQSITHEILNSKITNLCVSVDTFKKSTYEILRSGNFEKLTENIKYLYKQKAILNIDFPIVRLSCIVNEFNHDERDDIISYWKQYADIIEFQNLALPFETAQKNPKYYRSSFKCNDPWKRLTIQSNGDVYPCCAFSIFNRNLLLGNIIDRTIYEIWNGQKLNDLRKEISSGKYTKFSTCKDCQNSQYKYKVEK